MSPGRAQSSRQEMDKLSEEIQAALHKGFNKKIQQVHADWLRDQRQAPPKT